MVYEMHLKNQSVKVERNIEYPISDSQSWVYITITWKVFKNTYFQVLSLEFFTSRGLGNSLHVYFYISNFIFVYYALVFAHMYVCNRAIM